MHAKKEIQDKLTRVTDEPGVYLMKDDAGEILYIGKARNLRDQIRELHKYVVLET